MQKIGFEEAVVKIRLEDSRYDQDAYAFLKDALDHSVRAKQEKVGEEYPHVGGQELLYGFRDLALDEFGPMTATVLEIWGVTRTEDIGEMVFQLIGMGAFGKSDDDSRDDFKEVFSFDETFREPFRPRERKLPSGENRMTDQGVDDCAHLSQSVDNSEPERSADSQRQAGGRKGQKEQPKSN